MLRPLPPRAALSTTARRALDQVTARSPRASRAVVTRKLAAERSATWEVALLATAPRGRLAVDVGAHVGMISLALAERHERVLAFEPNPLALSRLLGAAPENVAVSSTAVSDRPGLRTLHVPVVFGREVASLGSLEAGDTSLRRLEVLGVRLDDLGLEDVDLLKIDVEGHEIEAVRGAAQLLATERPAVLVESEERHRSGAPTQLADILGDAGYEGWFVHRGEVLPVDRFDAASHQAEPPDVTGSVDSRYSHNFLYLPAERRDAWRPLLDAAVDRTHR